MHVLSVMAFHFLWAMMCSSNMFQWRFMKCFLRCECMFCLVLFVFFCFLFPGNSTRCRFTYSRSLRTPDPSGTCCKGIVIRTSVLNWKYGWQWQCGSPRPLVMLSIEHVVICHVLCSHDMLTSYWIIINICIVSCRALVDLDWSLVLTDSDRHKIFSQLAQTHFPHRFVLLCVPHVGAARWSNDCAK